jgi:hypothetical protein
VGLHEGEDDRRNGSGMGNLTYLLNRRDTGEMTVNALVKWHVQLLLVSSVDLHCEMTLPMKMNIQCESWSYYFILIVQCESWELLFYTNSTM